MAEFDDLKTHQEMWANFIRLTVWSCAAVATALVLMALFLL